MQEIFNFLRQFHPITEADFALLEAELRPKSARKGEALVLPGQVQRDMYFVLEGVQMSYFEHEDKLHVAAFTYPPNLAAIPDSFLYQQPSAYSFQCLSDSRFQAISHESMHRLMDESRSIERLFRRFAEALVVGLLRRQAELQSQGIEERFKAFCQRSPHLLQLAPHKYIASYLGIDRSNFSKLYNSVRI